MTANPDFGKPLPAALQVRGNQLPHELQIIDSLLERWATWIGRDRIGTEWQRISTIGKLMQKGHQSSRPPGTLSAEPPPGALLVDAAVSWLPQHLSQFVRAEYCTDGPAEAKGKALGVSRSTYIRELRSAQWLLYGRLAAYLEDDV